MKQIVKKQKKGVDFFLFLSIILYVAANAVACGSGGTGRRARLRGVWITPYGFKSRFPHQKKDTKLETILCLFSTQFIVSKEVL